MSETYSDTEKVYTTENIGTVSIRDMLEYFQERGVMRVSDLHLKIGAMPTYRIDGELVRLKGPPLTKEISEKLIFPLLSEKTRQAYEKNWTADASYRLGDIQFRINVFKDTEGICAAIRALSMDIPEIENVGFPNNFWKYAVDQKHGLVLVTGITGAGKSTTIASMISRISQRHACRVITLEDPVEYVYKQNRCVISQREVGRDVISFKDGLRSMMREDPDIIFVGEMRDPETISLALTAAETGHLVFSTLHTRDASGSITRILDYFPEGRQQEVRNQLSLGLRAIISQKLVPKLDGDGRVIAMEILTNNYAVANLIRINKVEQIYSQIQTKTQDRPDECMITMELHLARLVRNGLISTKEAMLWANKPKCFVDALQQIHK